jgi:hypothetical protein
VRAAGADAGEPGPLGGVQAGRAGQQPAGDLAGLGHGRGRGRCGGQLAEGADVAAYGLGAACPALGLQFGVQRGGVGDALVPPLVDPGLERVEFAVPAGGFDQQLVYVGLAGEPAYGVAVQAERAADGVLGVPGGEQCPDGGVPFAGPRHQGPLAAAHIAQPVRLSGRRGRSRGRCPGRVRPGRLAAGIPGLRVFFEAAAVRYYCLLGVLGQVVPQVPAVSDLDRVRCAVPGAFGVIPGPVPADHLRARMRRQPGLQGAGFPVRQQVDRPPGADVHQDGPVDLPAPQGEIIDPEDLRGGADDGLGQGGDEPQQRGPVRRRAQRGGQPGPGPARQREPDLGQ